MYSKLAYLAVLTIAVLPVYSQETYNQNTANTAMVFDANGRPFVNPNADVAGTPYFIKGWKYGTITMKNRAVYSKRLLRLELDNQEIHYLSETNVEMVLPTTDVKEITLADSAMIPVTQYHFRCGFPPIDNQNEKNMYQVICDGKIQLLFCQRKKIITERNDLTGESNREYRTYEDYYLFSGASIQRLKKDKTFLLEALNAQKNKVEAYVKENALGYKLIPDLKKIIDYYNSLP